MEQRRHALASYAETAAREVHEETGWLLDIDSLRSLGWLHLEFLDPNSGDPTLPHPDFLQVVFLATAHQRDGDPGVDWVDLDDGYEASSQLASLEEVLRTPSLDLPARVLLNCSENSSRNTPP